MENDKVRITQFHIFFFLFSNYRVLTSRVHDDLSCVPPGHPFAGQIGLGDVLLRMEHNVSGSRNARKALTAITTTGKNLGKIITFNFPQII